MKNNTIKKLIQLWKDFCYVRRWANQPLKGVSEFANGRAKLVMSVSTTDYMRRSGRLPKWLHKLAVAIAKR